jgi:hypothetical protein
MGKAKKPPKWINIYPQGTKEGDEEQKFFIALSRHPKWEWRSVAQMAKETGLTEKRIEEMINKYYKKGMVFQNPKNEIYWGYWERVPEMLPKDDGTIVQKDQKSRIKGALKGNGGANSKVEKLSCNARFLNEAKELEKRWSQNGLLDGIKDRFTRQVTAKMLESQRLWNEKQPFVNPAPTPDLVCSVEVCGETLGVPAEIKLDEKVKARNELLKQIETACCSMCCGG